MIGRPSSQWLAVRVGLFFVAAIVWLVGVSMNEQVVRWLAMGIAIVALAVGIVLRITEARKAEAAEPDG